LLLKYLYKNKGYYIFYFTCLYKKKKFLLYCRFKGKLREYDVKAYNVVLSVILEFLKVYKRVLIIYKSIKKYEIIYNLCLKIINIIKAILFLFMFIFNKLKNKIELFIMYRCRIALEIFSESSIFYLLFFFFANIIEYLAYLIKKNIKKVLK
jgi:hypothetical protein